MVLLEKSLKFDHKADLQISFFVKYAKDQIILPGIGDQLMGLKFCEFDSF